MKKLKQHFSTFFDPNTIKVLNLAITLKATFIAFIWFFYTLIPFNQLASQSNYFYKEADFTLGNLLSAWDGQWFVSIAEQGYPKNPENSVDLAKYVDFPLYPIVIRTMIGVTGLSAFIIGIFISFVASVIAAVFIFKLILMQYDHKIALMGTMLFLFSPMTIFFTAIYSESLFICLSAICFYFAKHHKWWLANFFGLLCALTRSVGLLLIILISYEFIKSFQSKLHFNYKFYLNMISLLLTPLGFIIFANYSKITSGVPNTYSVAQSFFGRSAPSLVNIIRYFMRITTDFFHYPIHSYSESRLEVLFIIFIISLAIYTLRALPLSYTIFNLSLLLLTLSSGTSTAIIRYFATSIPFYFALAILSSKNPLIFQIIKTTSILLCALFGLLYVNWYWVA